VRTQQELFRRDLGLRIVTEGALARREFSDPEIRRQALIYASRADEEILTRSPRETG